MSSALEDWDTDSGVEQIYADSRRQFENSVMERGRRQCSNCGGHDRVRVKMVVPEEAGGTLKVTNGVVLCRTCDMAKDSLPGAGSKTDTFVVSVWMSQNLREKVEGVIQPKRAFRSWSALSRYLIAKYVSDERRFDDLEQYQDTNSQTKVTVRVDKEIYGTFAAMLKRRGLTVTDALKSLYLMYSSNAGAIVKGSD